MRNSANRGKHAPTPLARRQTEERVQAGIAKLEAELERQLGSRELHNLTVDGTLDVRALYLVLDERAARYETE